MMRCFVAHPATLGAFPNLTDSNGYNVHVQDSKPSMIHRTLQNMMGVLQALVSYIGVPWLRSFKSSWNPFAVSQISTHRNPHFTSTTCFKPVFPINLPWFRFISFHTKFSPTPSFPIIDRPRRASKREIQLGSSASSNSSAACCWSGRTMPPLPLSKPLRGHQLWKRHRWFHRKLRRCPRFPRQDRRPGWYYWVGSATLCDPKSWSIWLVQFGIAWFLKGDRLLGVAKPASTCPYTEHVFWFCGKLTAFFFAVGCMPLCFGGMHFHNMQRFSCDLINVILWEAVGTHGKVKRVTFHICCSFLCHIIFASTYPLEKRMYIYMWRNISLSCNLSCIFWIMLTVATFSFTHLPPRCRRSRRTRILTRRPHGSKPCGCWRKPHGRQEPPRRPRRWRTNEQKEMPMEGGWRKQVVIIWH